LARETGSASTHHSAEEPVLALTKVKEKE